MITDSNFESLNTFLWLREEDILIKLTLLHSERPKLHRVLAFLSVIGLNRHTSEAINLYQEDCLFPPISVCLLLK